MSTRQELVVFNRRTWEDWAPLNTQTHDFVSSNVSSDPGAVHASSRVAGLLPQEEVDLVQVLAGKICQSAPQKEPRPHCPMRELGFTPHRPLEHTCLRGCFGKPGGGLVVNESLQTLWPMAKPYGHGSKARLKMGGAPKTLGQK